MSEKTGHFIIIWLTYYGCIAFLGSNCRILGSAKLHALKTKKRKKIQLVFQFTPTNFTLDVPF